MVDCVYENQDAEELQCDELHTQPGIILAECKDQEGGAPK